MQAINVTCLAKCEAPSFTWHAVTVPVDVVPACIEIELSVTGLFGGVLGDVGIERFASEVRDVEHKCERDRKAPRINRPP